MLYALNQKLPYVCFSIGRICRSTHCLSQLPTGGCCAFHFNNSVLEVLVLRGTYSYKGTNQGFYSTSSMADAKEIWTLCAQGPVGKKRVIMWQELPTSAGERRLLLHMGVGLSSWMPLGCPMVAMNEHEQQLWLEKGIMPRAQNLEDGRFWRYHQVSQQDLSSG